MKAKINLSFSKLSDADFGNLAQGVSNALDSSSYFPNPTPTLAELQLAVSAYITALADTQSKDKVKIGIKNDKRATLDSLMVQMGNFVTFTANGNKTMLLDSGYELAKEPESNPITKPENLQVADGLNPGELIVSVSGVARAKSYVHEYTTDPFAPKPIWVSTATTSRKVVFKNLEKAKEYWCRVGAVGTTGQFVYSDVVSRVVQ